MSSGVLENCNKHSSNDNTAATKIKQQAYVENNVSQQLTPLLLNYPTHSQDMHPRLTICTFIKLHHIFSLCSRHWL